MASPADDADRFGAASLVGAVVQVRALDGRFEPFLGTVAAWKDQECGYVVLKAGVRDTVDHVHASEMCYPNEGAGSSIDSGASDEPIALMGERIRRARRGYVGIGVKRDAPQGKPYEIRCEVFGKRCWVGAFSSEPQAARAYDFVMLGLATNGARRRLLNFPGELCVPPEERAYAEWCLATVRAFLRGGSAEAVDVNVSGARPQGQTTLGADAVTTSRFIGVDRAPRGRGGSYRARITVRGRRVDLGAYATPLEAGMAHNYAARTCGFVRYLNFPLPTNIELCESARSHVDSVLAALTPTGLPSANDTLQRTLEEISYEFRLRSNAGPLYVCTTCRQTWFLHSVRVLPRDLRARVGASRSTAWFSGCRSVEDKEWICNTCYKYASKGKCPPFAPSRQPSFRSVDAAVADLSGMENDLLALRLPFMKLRGLPPSAAGGPRRLGQLALRGMVINVPADLSRIHAISIASVCGLRGHCSRCDQVQHAARGLL